MNPTQQFFRPKSPKEAVNIMAQSNQRAKFLAGGTDLNVARHQGTDASPVLVDLSGIRSLTEISWEGEFLGVGAGASLAQVAKDPSLTSQFPLVKIAILSIASPLIRNSATIGGNLLCENRCSYFNQNENWRAAIGFCLKCKGQTCIATGGTKACFSRFVSDSAPALIALGAWVEILNPTGTRRIPLENMYSSEGIHPFLLEPADLITKILLPKSTFSKIYFRKLRLRESMDFTSLTVAATHSPTGPIRICLSGVDSGPVVLSFSPDQDPESLVKFALKKSRLVENDTFSRAYKRKMIRAFVLESIRNPSH